MKYEPKIILCPSCKHKVGTYDGRSTINFIARCNNCKKRVIYHAGTNEIELKDIPERNCSSGMTFI